MIAVIFLDIEIYRAVAFIRISGIKDSLDVFDLFDYMT